MTAFFSSGINKTAKQELKSSFFRYQNDRYAKVSSLKGRIVCFLLLPVHLSGIGLKPIMYTAISLKNCVKTIFLTLVLIGKERTKPSYQKTKSRRNAAFFDGVHSGLSIAASPFGQIAQVCKASIGIIMPSAYFKGPHKESANKETEMENKPKSQFEPGNEVEIIPPFEIEPSALQNSHRIEQMRSLQIYYIDCDMDYPSHDPEEALKHLAYHYQNRPAGMGFGLKISYLGQPGLDTGGLSRDYIYRLFAALSSKHNLQHGVINCDEENQHILEQIGTAFGYFTSSLGNQTCSRFPIGDAFHAAYFQGILSLSYEEIRGEASALPAERLLEIAHVICTDNESAYVNQLQALLAWNGNESDAAGKENVEFIKNAAISEGIDLAPNFSAELATHLPQIKQDLLEAFADRIFGRVKTVHTIAKAMDCTEEAWDTFRGLGEQNLQNHIQGAFSKDNLKGRLRIFCRYADVEDVRQRVMDWVDTKTDEELRHFLKFVYGAPCIPTSNIIFNFLENWQTVVAHSCDHRIDLPLPPEENKARERAIQSLLTSLDEYCLDIPASFDVK